MLLIYFFGVLRAIKERKINSCIGINGLIRKTGMIASSVFLFCIDNLLQFNFIGFIPEIIRSTIKINFIGIGGLFSILFIVFESLSILKNMYLFLVFKGEVNFVRNINKIGEFFLLF